MRWFKWLRFRRRRPTIVLQPPRVGLSDGYFQRAPTKTEVEKMTLRPREFIDPVTFERTPLHSKLKEPSDG